MNSTARIVLCSSTGLQWDGCRPCFAWQTESVEDCHMVVANALPWEFGPLAHQRARVRGLVNSSRQIAVHQVDRDVGPGLAGRVTGASYFQAAAFCANCRAILPAKLSAAATPMAKLAYRSPSAESLL